METQQAVYRVRTRQSGFGARRILAASARLSILRDIFLYVEVLVLLQEHPTGLVVDFVGLLAGGRRVSVAVELLHPRIRFLRVLKKLILLA